MTGGGRRSGRSFRPGTACSPLGTVNRATGPFEAPESTHIQLYIMQQMHDPLPS